MMLPFVYSLKDAALDLLGLVLYSEIPPETLDALSLIWIVDLSGIGVWSFMVLCIGIWLGRKTKRTKKVVVP